MSIISSPQQLMTHKEDKTKPSLLYRRVSLIRHPPLTRPSSPNPPTTTEIHHALPATHGVHKSSLLHLKQKKSVRFHDNTSLENVRLFLKTQMPKACRSDPVCPKKYVYRLKCPNWPSESTHTRRRSNGTAVRMENIALKTTSSSESLCLTGTCQVANIAFEKRVTIVYTQDEWVTHHQVDAVFQESIASSANTWDRFRFDIKLDNLRHAHKTLYMAIKYQVCGREFWDNNDSQNYEVNIVPRVQLQQLDDYSSSSPSDDDENVFEECDRMDEDDDSLSAKFNVLTVKDPYPRNPTFYNSETTPHQYYSPPTSPDTPTDIYPPWADHPTYFDKQRNRRQVKTHPKSKIPLSTTSLSETDYDKFHEIIQKYCFYQENRPASYYSAYATDSSQCTSP